MLPLVFGELRGWGTDGATNPKGKVEFLDCKLHPFFLPLFAQTVKLRSLSIDGCESISGRVQKYGMSSMIRDLLKFTFLHSLQIVLPAMPFNEELLSNLYGLQQLSSKYNFSLHFNAWDIDSGGTLDELSQVGASCANLPLQARESRIESWFRISFPTNWEHTLPALEILASGFSHVFSKVRVLRIENFRLDQGQMCQIARLFQGAVDVTVYDGWTMGDRCLLDAITGMPLLRVLRVYLDTDEPVLSNSNNIISALTETARLGRTFSLQMSCFAASEDGQDSTQLSELESVVQQWDEMRRTLLGGHNGVKMIVEKY